MIRPFLFCKLFFLSHDFVGKFFALAGVYCQPLPVLDAEQSAFVGVQFTSEKAGRFTLRRLLSSLRLESSVANMPSRGRGATKVVRVPSRRVCTQCISFVVLWLDSWCAPLQILARCWPGLLSTFYIIIQHLAACSFV